MGSLVNYALVFSISFLIWVFVVLLFLITHEIGHMIFYRIFFKNKDWKITLGEGKRIISVWKIEINLRYFWVGKFTYKKPIENSKYKQILVNMGGIIFNFISL